MEKYSVLSLTIALALSFQWPVFAQMKNMEHSVSKDVQDSAETSAQNSPEKAVDVKNKICPVSGEEVGVMGPAEQYEYKGKIYNFCCASCIDSFKKDPEKYIKIIEKQKEAEGASKE